MGIFDEIDRRFRAREYDTWGLISTKHKAPECKADVVVAVEPDEGGPCNKQGCDGKYEFAYIGDGCSCHVSPPCSYCTSSYIVCAVCGYEPYEVPS